jgi:hypothetical protein
MSMVPDVWRQPFPESEIPFILTGILRCMAAVKKKYDCERENPITTRLWKRLRRDAELNARPTHLDPEAWEVDENDEDGKIGRLDLRFLFSTGTFKPWPCFAIEAKRLHVTFPKAGWSSLVPEYVTSITSKPVEKEQGMMCFVSGRYSRGLRAGAMLGYVFDGKVEAARDSITTAIQTHAKKLKLVPSTRLTDSIVLPGNSGISESLHDIADEIDVGDLLRERFTIYHLLVAV